MSYDMVKYERGQVWIIRHKQKSEAVGHEQMKDRPWLILSVGKFNKSSGCVTAVPITTRDCVRTVSQVLFQNDSGRSNVIMCEQIKTFDYSSGAYIFDYLGQLSDEILEKVDIALSVHLGLHYSPITLKSLYDSMESIIKSVGYLQDKDSSPKFTDDDVLNFAEKLQSLAGVTAKNEVAATKNSFYIDNSYANEDLDKAMGIIEDEGDIPEESQSLEHSLVKPFYVTPPESPKASVSEKAPRNKWSKENCEQFLADCNSMPMLKVMNKWNISKKTRYYSTKNYVQNLLTKMTQS